MAGAPPPPPPHHPRPWSDLHADALHLISQKLTLIFDYVSFRSVCTSCRSAAVPLSLPPQTPILMIPCKDPLNHIREFFSLDNRRLCNLNLPEALDRRCLASIHGHLLVLGTDPSIFLLNPFTRAQIPLPPFTTMPGVLDFNPEEEMYTCDFGDESGEDMRDEMVVQAVISNNPAATGNSDCVVMVTLHDHMNQLAFCRPGDISWTRIDTASRNFFVALTYYNGRFYAVDRGNIVVCDISVSPPRVVAIPSLKRKWDEQCYFVGSATGLFFIERYRVDDDDEDDDGHVEEFFDVFKMMDAQMAVPRWEKIDSLDGEAMFLCASQGYLVSASDCPGIEPNCIYCSDTFDETMNPSEHKYVTVFRMKDVSTRLIECYLDKNLIWFPTGWLRPSL